MHTVCRFSRYITTHIGVINYIKIKIVTFVKHLGYEVSLAYTYRNIQVRKCSIRLGCPFQCQLRWIYVTGSEKTTLIAQYRQNYLCDRTKDLIIVYSLQFVSGA